MILVNNHSIKPLCSYYLGALSMPGRKFKLSQRKNEERRKRSVRQNERKCELFVSPEPEQQCYELKVSIPLALVKISAFKLSLPLSLYFDGHVSTVDSLHSWLLSQSLPDSWVVSSKSPLILAKIRVQCHTPSARADVAYTLSIGDNLS